VRTLTRITDAELEQVVCHWGLLHLEIDPEDALRRLLGVDEGGHEAGETEGDEPS
jgi:hypothetical protein